MSKPEPLTADKIIVTIRLVCDTINTSQTEWSFTESPTARTNALAANNNVGDGSTSDQVNLYGIAAKPTSGEDSSSCSYFTTFYLAYSTWDGRVLFRDYTTTINDENKDGSLSKLWYYVLSNIAIGLNCNRFVWTHYYGQGSKFHGVQPDTLPGWLTLCWNLDEMRKYTKEETQIISTDHGSLIRDDFALALQKQQEKQQPGKSVFALRLASAADTPHIARLVRGLAEFEKEPESVHIGACDYAVDGFEGVPLFHCILVESVVDNMHICGMAFCYLANQYETGRFLFLEDLFFEEKYRGKGGGTMVMGALALAAQLLGCQRMVWQALDWNAPALSFYDKIGAKVQSGLLTCRFTGTALREFASSQPM